jgi:hypothetical protein
MGNEILFWALMGLVLPMALIVAIAAAFRHKAEIQALSREVWQFWLQWAKWSRGQRLFMACAVMSFSLATLLVCRGGALAAEWASVNWGDIPADLAVVEAPLGSWGVTALLVLGIQALAIGVLEYRRITMPGS